MSRSLAIALVGLVMLAGCSAAAPTSGVSVATTIPAPTLEDAEVAADATGNGPRGGGSGSVVILVPGGGWATADPSGLLPLAENLNRNGVLAATLTYRAAEDGIHFPEQVQDVACGIARSVAEIDASGFKIEEVVVVGHSAGAHLGSLVALSPVEFGTTCASPMVIPDRFIGLAGPYDVVRARSFATDLFGPEAPDPTTWGPGNPLELAGERPEVDFLLVHGKSDETVPTQFTESFAEALREGGHRVTTLYPDDVDHHTVYSADVATPLILDWLARAN